MSEPPSSIERVIVTGEKEEGGVGNVEGGEEKGSWDAARDEAARQREEKAAVTLIFCRLSGSDSGALGLPLPCSNLFRMECGRVRRT